MQARGFPLLRVLDVTFGEDQIRARDSRIADNLAWLIRLAIGLLKRHPSKISLSTVRKKRCTSLSLVTG